MDRGLHAVSTRSYLSGSRLTSMTYRMLSTHPFDLCEVLVFRHDAGHFSCTWGAKRRAGVYLF
jgi:hypothetical protein